MGIMFGSLIIDLWLFIVIVILVIAFVVFVINRVIVAHRLQETAGREEMVGKTAEVLVALKPKGTVLIEGERWSAISEAGRIGPGEEVVITKVDGLKLYVDKKQ
jgi:membrane-bound ClpP family serine protease